jgi:hypothetical protein
MSGIGRGAVVLSVDLELDLSLQRRGLEERLDDVRSWLVGQMRELRLPATWAVADPVRSAATEPVLTSGVGHEIAVLGDQTWIGPGAGRLRLDRELARRFDGARRAGIPVTTLALRNVREIADLELLLDRGITAVRGPAVDSAHEARLLSAPPTRFGIWQPPVAWRIPPRRLWWLPSAWRIGHEIRRQIARGGMLHLEIDASRLAASDQDELSVIRAVLLMIAARRDAGQLTIDTIGQLAAEALDDRLSVPSRSVLRSAA